MSLDEKVQYTYLSVRVVDEINSSYDETEALASISNLLDTLL
jgi:hypothetical protein